MEKVTESDLVEALRAALQNPAFEDGMTTLEIADQLGCSKYMVLIALHKLDDEKKLKVVKVQRRNLVGVHMTIPGYALKE